MSQTKAQLIQPIGIVTAGGVVVTGVVTASSFDGEVVGTATSIISGGNLNLGTVNATTFSGDFTGTATGINTGADIKVGQFTASSFTGDFTGTATSMFRGTGFKAGAVNATGFHVSGSSSGNVTGDVTGNVVGNITGDVDGNASGLAGGLGVNYNGGWPGAGTSQISAGVVTATSFHGDGSNLDGVTSGPVSGQSIGITSASTAIDLSNGNLIYATQSANTTVSFANTSNGNVYFIRTKDDNTTTRTISWPGRIRWDGGFPPTLSQSAGGASRVAQTFLLVTRDMGVTWYGKEIVNYDTLTGYTLYSWGGNESSGQLGHNNQTYYSSPVQIPGTDWARLPNGHYGYGVGVMKSNKTLWGWGRNDHGILGENISPPSQYSSPVQIGSATWANFSVGRESIMATKSNGTMWGWGENYYGNLGLNEGGHPGQKSSPVQLPGTTWPTSLDEFAISSERGMAIKTNGTLWVWGRNYEGQLGLNDRDNNYSSPTQVGTDTTWAKVAQGGDYGAIKTNGTLWMMGYNNVGNLGQNNRTYYSSPTQVGTDTTWRTIYQKSQVNVATKTDGTLWSWGYAHYGCLGQNEGGNTPLKSSPTQIGTGTDWSSQIALKGTWWAALKTDGSMWLCGANSQGVLGKNDRTQRSSPAQIPGTWVGIFAAGAQSCSALQ